MLLKTIIYSLAFSSIVSLLLTYGFKRKGPGPANGLLFFMVIIFMFSWSIGAWLAPFGPVHWGVPWVGYLILTLIVMMLIGVIVPRSKPPKQKVEKRTLSDYELFEKEANAYPLGITFGMFFWIMILLLFSIAVVKLFYQLT